MNIPSHPYILLDWNILCNCHIGGESNFLLESLAPCNKHKRPDLQMYFTVNLAFIDYLEQLNDTLTIPINRNWTNVKHPIPISLNSFQISLKLIHVPMMLKDFMEHYHDNRMTIVMQDKPQSKFRKFIKSFLIDMLMFIAAVLTVFIVLMIIYILTGQSKLKTLITTMALQRVRAMEALNMDRQIQNCNSRLIKILMILNLIVVVSLLLRKVKKSVFFWGQPFSNMVKIKRFVADTKSYVSLNLNQSTGNAHLFKLIGELSSDRVALKKNWIWDVLTINWGNTHIILDNKEIHLPATLPVPLFHKLKIRNLFGKRDLMHVYIMLKQ